MFSFQKVTLILDDFLYLYNVKAVRHSYLWILFKSERSTEKDRKGHKYLFYSLNYLECKRGMTFISFRNETHFGIMSKGD